MAENKKDLKVFDGINLSNSIDVLKRLKQFRIDGKAEQLKEIIHILNISENAEIKNNIVQILNDLKDKASIPFLINEIKNSNNKEIQHILVTACWQNGLDYSAHFKFFIELMIDCSYLTAIEAFTVIEVMEPEFKNDELDLSIDLLKNSLGKFEEDKQFLVKELIVHLNSKKMAG